MSVEEEGSEEEEGRESKRSLSLERRRWLTERRSSMLPKIRESSPPPRTLVRRRGRR